MALNITAGILDIPQGGTSAGNALEARVNLLPTLTGNAGKVLAVNTGATDIEYIPVVGGGGTVTSVGLSAPAMFAVTNSPISTNGTITLSYSGTALPIANGGTGATTTADARIGLGLGTSATVNTGTSGATIPLLNGANTWSGVQTFTTNVLLNNNVPFQSKDSGGTTRTLLSVGADNFVNIVNVGNARIRILNQAGSGELASLADASGNASFNGTVTSAGFIGNASTATNLSTNRANWSTNGTISAVVGQLAWKNYSNNHTIFDASQGTAPNGSAINNTNSQVAWTGTYPTLMGWNGNNTYGVRVDSARIADSAKAFVEVINPGAPASFTAVSGVHYLVWYGGQQVVLPAAPAVGSTIYFTSYSGNFTILRNGKAIMGLAEDLFVNIGGPGASMKSFGLRFTEDSVNIGWVLI